MSHQTPYLGIEPLASGLFYDGGIHQFWYTRRSNIDVWPAIDPETQELATEPTLITDATWLGPIKVQDRSLGFTEVQEKARAGNFYKQKVFGFHIGNDRRNQSNLYNHGQDQFILIAQQRAGGFFLVLGNPEAGLEFDHESNTGEGSLGVAGTKFTFTTESQFKALPLATFSESPSTLPGGVTLPGGAGTGGTSGTAQTEVIEFTNVSSVNVAWTPARLLRFGQYPHIEVWIQDSGFYFKATSIDIRVDLAPPNQTQFTIYPGGTASGFIVLK